jgi:reactive intermediate/imine deaminase
MKTAIHTRNAPEAIGTYSQAVRAGDTVYLSGQIGLDPATMQMAEGIEGQTHRVFRNLAAVAGGAGLSLDHCVRMTIYLTDLAHFARVNEIMAQYVKEPYPARAAVGVAGLPRGAVVEIDAILHAGG